MQTAPLSMLSIAEINVRKTKTGAEPKMAASIRAKGVIEPLTVRQTGEGFTITNGGKRFAALQFLRDNNEYAKGERVTDLYPVPIIVRDESDAEARETSLITNLVRADMHPVDLHQAFVDLINDGKTEKDLAAEYLMTDREVKQVLALGQLSPKVREAWKAGKIDAEIAKAFTVGQTHAIQEKALKEVIERIDDEDAPDADEVKELFKLSGREIGAMLEFVGLDEYEKQGGKVKRDLFGIDHAVSNEKLVEKMAVEKLDAECDRLVKEDGWAWAVRSATVKQQYDYGNLKVQAVEPNDDEKREIEKLKAKTGAHGFRRYGDTFDNHRAFDELELLEGTIEARGYSAEQKAKAGCFVSISDTGVLEITFGKVKPQEQKAAAAVERAVEKKAKSKDKAPGEKAEKKPNLQISQSLMQALCDQLTDAAAEVLSANTELALPALLAGFSCNETIQIGSPVGRPQNFDKAFQGFRDAGQKNQIAALAKIVGGFVQLRPRVHGELPLKDKGNLALCEALGAPLYVALKKHFDPKEYFGSVNAHICRKNLKEMFGTAYQAKWDAEKKSALEKVAVTKAKETGWLPPELRTSFYPGPGAEKKRKAA